MWFYVLSFFVIFFIVWFTKRNVILMILLILYLVFIIGFRHEVGCDWFNYLEIYEYNDSFYKLFPPYKDFLYDFLNYIAHKLSLGIYFVNTVVASILVLGLFLYSKTKKYYPFLIIYSIPYLLFVVGMGYTRQALAIGFLFLSLFFFEKRKEFLGFINLILAFLSHKTAIVLLFFYTILKPNLYSFLFSLMAIGISYFSYKNSVNYFIHAYVENKLQSKGFFLRFLQTSFFLVPFLIFYRKYLNLKNLYLPFIVLYLLIIPILILTKSTTVADRFLLYTYPLQLFAIDFILRKTKGNLILKIAIILISVLTLFIWFNFAIHKICWIPYKNILFNF